MLCVTDCPGAKRKRDLETEHVSAAMIAKLGAISLTGINRGLLTMKGGWNAQKSGHPRIRDGARLETGEGAQIVLAYSSPTRPRTLDPFHDPSHGHGLRARAS